MFSRSSVCYQAFQIYGLTHEISFNNRKLVKGPHLFHIDKKKIRFWENSVIVVIRTKTVTIKKKTHKK